MMKKCFGLLMLCILCVLLPTGALALMINGVELENGQYLPSNSQMAQDTPPAEGGYAFYQDATLYLNHFQLECTLPQNNNIAAVYHDNTLSIVVSGTNTISASHLPGLLTSASCSISGSGTLSLTASRSNAISVDYLAIQGDQLSVTANGSQNGILCSHGLKVLGSQVNASGAEKGISAANLTISGETSIVSVQGRVSVTYSREMNDVGIVKPLGGMFYASDICSFDESYRPVIAKDILIKSGYSLTFDNNEGEELPPPISVYLEKNSQYTLPAISADGFVGWNTRRDGTGTAYANQATLTITEDMILYAQWSSGVVHFMDGGGSGSMEDVVVSANTYTLPECSFNAPEGHSFAGWYVNERLYQPGETISVTGDTYVTAGWTVNQYTITFDSNGGSSIAPITQDYATAIHPPVNPSRKGYSFVGWDPALPSTMPAQDMTVTACWSAVTYTVSFDANGGSGELAPVSGIAGTYELPSCPFAAPEGYQFKCWEVNGISYAPGEVINVTSSTIIKAVWEAIPAATVLPQTGDNSKIALWFSLMMMSAVAFVNLRRKHL